MTKSTKHTILIVCEGENTEPLFFNSIRDAIKDGVYNIGNVEINIKPEPKLNETNDKGDVTDTHKSKRKTRQTKAASVGPEPTEIKAPLPLKWVLEAQEELKDGTCNEAWTVFDHDDHPARKKAFEAAEKEVSGSKVNIAFTSRSFEYYLLLHFERIFKEFKTSECRDKNNEKLSKRDKIIECGTNKYIDDCHGQLCIGGYARSEGFWVNSKGSESTFKLIKDKLETGFENSAWLRHVSDVRDSDKDIWDRNPYVTVDSIVKRLTGYENRTWSWVPTDLLYNHLNKIDILVTDRKIAITNKDTKALVIGPESFQEVKTDNTPSPKFGSQKIIDPNEIFEVPINVDNNSWFFIFQLDENHSLMFDFNNGGTKLLSLKKDKLLSLKKELFSLSNKELTEIINILKSNMNR